MQEFFDNQAIQVKRLSGFDITKEQEYLRMSVYDYFFHLWVREENDDS